MALALLLGLAAALAPGEARAYTIIDLGGVPTEGWDGPGQGSATLTYHLAQGTPDLTNELAIIEAALAEWASHVQITFVHTDTPGLPGSLDFFFNTNGVLFDGPGGNLGAAFGPDDVTVGGLFGLPEIAGDVFFDEDETWIDTGVGPGSCSVASCSLYNVALHEIGHALGLGHTTPGAVMYDDFGPPGSGFGSFGTLQPDDIAGIQSLYAAGTGALVVPEPGTAVLLAAGLLGLGRLRRRQGPPAPRAARP